MPEEAGNGAGGRVKVQKSESGLLIDLDYNEVDMKQAEAGLNEIKRQINGMPEKSAMLLIRFERGGYPAGLKEMWLAAADEVNPVLKGMAIHTNNMLVKVAAKTYMTYLRFLKKNAILEVHTFPTVDECRAWLESL